MPTVQYLIPENEAGVADRKNEGKPELSYLLDFPAALQEFAAVCTYGARKYSRDNWKKGGKPDQEYFDAALRHMLAARSGEIEDPESGAMHLAHAMWNLMACMELNYNNKNEVCDGVGQGRTWNS